MNNIGSILFFASLALGGAAYGYRCAQTGKASRLGRYVGFLLLGLFAGLLLAGLLGSETLGWLSGLGLMGALPASLIALAASALGRFVYRRTRR